MVNTPMAVIRGKKTTTRLKRLRKGRRIPIVKSDSYDIIFVLIVTH